MKNVIMTAGLICGLGASSVSAEMLNDLKSAADLGVAVTASGDADTAKVQGEVSIKALVGGPVARGSAGADPVSEGAGSGPKAVLKASASSVREPLSAPAVAGPLPARNAERTSDGGGFKKGFMKGFSAVEGLAGRIFDLGIDGQGNFPMPTVFFIPAVVGAVVAAVVLAPVAAVAGLIMGIGSFL